MTKARSNATANAAKGDLTVGNGTNLSGVLGVGSNGETIVADSSTSTGLRYNPQNALANPVINGGMDIWQRGTSFSGTNTAFYTADRWVVSSGGSFAVSRQTTSDTTNLPNIQYAARLGRASGGTTTNGMGLYYNMENINSTPFLGKTITLSFYARRGANFSGASNEIFIQLVSGTGTDQNLGTTGYTGGVGVINTTQALTTTWTRYAFTGTVATNATQLGFYTAYAPTGTAGAADHYEMTGFQIDLGTYTASTAPTFRRAGGSIQGELAACQRYYYRQTAPQGYSTFGQGSADSTTVNQALVIFPVTMRIAPTSLDFSTLANYDGTGTQPVTSATLGANFQSTSIAYVFATVASGLTQYRPYRLIANNSTSAYLGFSAEL